MDTKNKLLKFNGVVINDENYNEYDKLITILTKEVGKIKVYAFNSRKQNSKSISVTRLFTFATFELREINNKYQLDGAKINENFQELTEDYNNTCYASYFIELIDYFLFENMESEDIYNLFYFTLKALVSKKMNPRLIRRVFELKMLEYSGEYKDSSRLSSDNKTLIYTWDYIINTLPNKLYNFNLTDEIFLLFDNEVSIEMKDKVNKKFKSLEKVIM